METINFQDLTVEESSSVYGGQIAPIDNPSYPIILWVLSLL